MINNDSININYTIPDNIREYFKKEGINVDEIFEEINFEKLLIESNNDLQISHLIQALKSIESNSNQHKLLLGAVLVELRSQVKKNQQQLSELRKQSEFEQKELTKTVKENLNKTSSVNTELVSFYNKFINYIKTLFVHLNNELINVKREYGSNNNKLQKIENRLNTLENNQKNILKNIETIIKQNNKILSKKSKVEIIEKK